MARARTARLYVLPALAIVLAWTRIEQPRTGLPRAVAVAVIALAPALVSSVRLRLLAVAGAVLVGPWVALGVSPLHPGRLFSRLGSGTVEFYDVTLPFDPSVHPRMQGALLAAVFAFCLAVALALAGSRVLFAGLVLVAGAGWPATLLRGRGELLLGGLILAALLVMLAGLRPRSGRVFVQAAGVGGVVVACALALSSSSAIAKGAFLGWQNWDLYTRPDKAVGISYVWDSDYGGIDWPRKSTTVFKVKAPNRALYWRATTLDTFVGDRWIEDLTPTFSTPLGDGRAELTNDPQLPRRARRPEKWVKQEVTVEALEDKHLVGADVPVAYAPGEIGSVSYAEGGTALVLPGQDRGKTYTVWSYVAQPTPTQLAGLRPYTQPISVERGVSVPPFGSPGRERQVRRALLAYAPAYLPLYREAERVVGRARSEYAAVVGLESWLRDSGLFHYDEHPPSVAGVPPLVAFVTSTRRGYCQHFAGAMALMLRYLGIPARVAAGFTSGTYDDHTGTWTVSDRDAHTWVEVWFQGYGWLPFDPTPGRGGLAASYTSSSKSFDASTAAALVGGGALKSLLENRAVGGAGRRIPGPNTPPAPTKSGQGSRAVWLAGLLLLALVALALALFLGKLARRRLRFLTRDPRRLAGACRRELVEFLLDQRIEIPQSASLAELAATIDAELDVGATGFAEAAGSARFGTPAAAREGARRARRELRILRRLLRSRLAALERLSGALSLRSLRRA